MPRGRTSDYIIWKACERFNLIPPGVKKEWDNCSVLAQAMLLGYDDIRNREEMELLEAQMQIMGGVR